MATFPIAYLRDDFENNVIDPAWTKTTSGSATGAETGGQAVFTLPSSTAGTHEALYTSNASYDLTGDSAVIAIGTMVATGVAATAYVRLFIDGLNYYEWTQTSTTLKARKIVAGVATDLFSATWSSTTHKYLRIRESGGTVFFDSSTSASAGAAWTNRGSTTIASAIAVTALFVNFGASCGNIASPGSFRLDMFNVILPALSSTWRDITADWQITNRIRPITIASTGNKVGVIVTAQTMDASRVLGGTVRYFAGPVGSLSGGYAQLTEYSSLASAQANPFQLPVDGRIDLPTLVDCRFVRLYQRSSDGSSGTIREFFPRRITQSDDVEAESIRAINIAASTISGDKITATFTITGRTIQTGISGARTVMSGDDFGGLIGYSASDTYNTTTGVGTYQILWSKADGKFYFANGIGVLDASGIALAATTSYNAQRAYKFTASGSTENGLIAIDIAAGLDVRVESYITSGVNKSASVSLASLSGVSGQASQIFLTAVRPLGGISFETLQLNIQSNASGSSFAFTGAPISTDSSVAFGATALSNVRVYTKGQDATASNYAHYANDSTGTLLWYVRNDGAGYLKAAAWTYGSDRRFKVGIRDIPVGRGMEAVRALRARSFRYRGKPQTHLGFIAQELQTIAPELIEELPQRGRDGTPMLGVRTDELLPLLVTALQELDARVRALGA